MSSVGKGNSANADDNELFVHEMMNRDIDDLIADMAVKDDAIKIVDLDWNEDVAAEIDKRLAMSMGPLVVPQKTCSMRKSTRKSI